MKLPIPTFPNQGKVHLLLPIPTLSWLTRNKRHYSRGSTQRLSTSARNPLLNQWKEIFIFTPSLPVGKYLYIYSRHSELRAGIPYKPLLDPESSSGGVLWRQFGVTKVYNPITLQLGEGGIIYHKGFEQQKH